MGRNGLERENTSTYEVNELEDCLNPNGAKSGAFSPENGLKGSVSVPPRLELLADLLIDLPEDQRRKMISTLSILEKQTIAELLLQQEWDISHD